uniref:Tripartite motif containing 36 n=1 Tax=Eptatretus burgeri TaxID=7764 RepID=A0A8C4NJR2_EPTBU
MIANQAIGEEVEQLSLIQLSSIERELTCPACQELLSQPLLLPCLHSLCFRCVRDGPWGRGAETTTFNLTSPTSAPTTMVINSPRVGRRAIATPEHGEKLTRSGGLSFDSVAERLFPQTSAQRVVLPCQACRPPGRYEATRSCLDCRASFCTPCCKAQHPWGTPRAQHEFVPPTTRFRSKVVTCPDHDGERLSLYCEPCRRPLCPLCRNSGEHSTHRLLSLLNAHRTIRDKLSRSVAHLIGKEDEVKEAITTIEKVIEETEVSGQSAREVVSDGIDALLEALGERRASLLTAAECSERCRLAELRRQLQETRGMLDCWGLIGLAQEVLRENDQLAFVLAARHLHCRVVKAIEALKTFMPAAIPSFQGFQLDVSQELKLISNLSFWKGKWQRNRTKYQLLGFYEARSSANEAVSSAYAVRVQAFGPAGSSDYSQELIFYTTPAEGEISTSNYHGPPPRRSILQSQAPLGIIAQLAERPCPTGTFLPLDHIVGDFAITRGRHAWAVNVDPSSCVVRVGVANATKLPDWFSTSRQLSSPRFEQDSGHDSGSEEVETAQPSLLITIARGRLFLPRGQTVSAAGLTNTAAEALPLPHRLTVCLDHDEGWVAFYNSDGTPSCFCRRLVDCSGPVYPAFGMLGGGKLRIHPLDLG